MGLNTGNSPTENRRWGVFLKIGATHFASSMFLLLLVFSEGMKPIPDPNADWLMIPFTFLLFPGNVPMLIGMSDSMAIAFVLLPVTSTIWGWLGARILVRGK